jgi:thioredoxin
MTTIDLTTENWEKQVLTDPKLVLVDFWAPWCPWCRKLAPDYEALSAEYQGKVKFAKLDADANPEIAAKYGVQGLPTLKFFCMGRPVAEIVGYLPKPALKAEIERTLPIYKQCVDQSSRLTV